MKVQENLPIISLYLTDYLGRGSSKSQIISSILLSVLIIFYVYYFASYFHLTVYPLKDRFTIYTNFSSHLVSEQFDQIVMGISTAGWFFFSARNSKIRVTATCSFAILLILGVVLKVGILASVMLLLSLPVVIAIVVFVRFSQLFVTNVAMLTIKYLGIIALGFGIQSVIYSLGHIAPLTSGKQVLQNYQYDLFLILSLLSPAVILVLASNIPIRLLLRHIKPLQQLQSRSNDDYEKVVLLRKSHKIVLISIIASFSLFISLIPHLPTINPDGKPIGVDTGYYVNWVGALYSSKSPEDFFHQAFVAQSGGDRPLSLIFIFGFTHMINGDLGKSIEFLPLLLSPITVVILYYLTRELTRNDYVSIIAAFLTTVSFHVLIGIYAGFYANWVALLIGYAALIFFVRFLSNPTRQNMICFSALIIGLLFAHVYTWTILTIVMGIVLIVLALSRKYARKSIIFLASILLLSIAIDIANSNIIGASSGVYRDIEIAGSDAGPGNYAQRWSNLRYSVHVAMGGIFSDFLFYGLSIYWLLTSRLSGMTNILISIFLSISIIPIIFGTWVLQVRLLYDIPFQIPAALAISQIGRKKESLAIVSLFVWFVAISIQMVSNFIIVPPA